MNIAISVKGRFHAFDLARELQELGALTCLISSYPEFEIKKYGIKEKGIRSLFLHEVLERLDRKFIQKRYGNLNQYRLAEYFDSSVSRMKLNNIDLMIGWSSFFLHTLNKCKDKNILTVVERGSSHILFQKNILEKEYGKLGIKATLPHEKIVKKELAEYEKADYISVPSTFVKDTFITNGVSENKLIVNNYGVSLKNFNSKYKKKGEKFRVMFCGTLSIRKGAHYLLQAFSELNLPDAELFFIGTLLDEVKPFLIKYNKNVVYHEPVRQDELVQFYSQSDIFCLPSLEEGMAMVIAQAMACGLPVVCTQNTGGGDIVRSNVDGVIINAMDLDEIKSAILKLYEDRKLVNEMSANARERVKSGYTWQDYGRRAFSNYSKILSNTIR